MRTLVPRQPNANVFLEYLANIAPWQLVPDQDLFWGFDAAEFRLACC
jgi:hypothetical protein